MTHNHFLPVLLPAYLISSCLLASKFTPAVLVKLPVTPSFPDSLLLPWTQSTLPKSSFSCQHLPVHSFPGWGLHDRTSDSSAANADGGRRRRRHQSAGGVSNIGAEQDEGITSLEIKGRVSCAHQNKTTASPGPQYLSPVTDDLLKVLFYLLSTKCLLVRVRRDVHSLRPSLFVARPLFSNFFFPVEQIKRKPKREKKKEKKETEERDWTCSVFPPNNPRRLSLCLCICWYLSLASDSSLELYPLLSLCLALPPSIWGDSAAQKPLRPDKSNHHTDRMSLELCVTRFDPAALSAMLRSMQRPPLLYLCLLADTDSWLYLSRTV